MAPSIVAAVSLTLAKRASVPSMPSMNSARPSQAKQMGKWRSIAASSASSATAPPEAVKTWTENPATRRTGMDLRALVMPILPQPPAARDRPGWLDSLKARMPG